MSPLLSFANKAPNFLELSSISRFLAGFAREPPNASDVSLYSLVNVDMTGFWWAGAWKQKRVLQLRVRKEYHQATTKES